jgi:hypothetical protein
MRIVPSSVRLDRPAVPLRNSLVAVRAGGGAHLSTVAFPNGAHLSTLTRYRGAISVSNSRAFGNGGVSNSLEFTLQRVSPPPGGGPRSMLASSQGMRSTLKRELQQVRFAAQDATVECVRFRRKAARWQWLRKCKNCVFTGQLFRQETQPQTKASRCQPATDPKVDMQIQAPLYFESAERGADGVRLHPTRLLTRPA